MNLPDIAVLLQSVTLVLLLHFVPEGFDQHPPRLRGAQPRGPLLVAAPHFLPVHRSGTPTLEERESVCSVESTGSRAV